MVDSGLAKFTITDELLSGKTPFRLTTNMLNTVFKGIKDKYGPNQLCEVVCEALQYPAISLVPEELQGISSFLCSLDIVSTGETAASFEMSSLFTGTFNVDNWTLKGRIDDFELVSLKVVGTSGVECDYNNLKYLLNASLKVLTSTLDKAFFGPGVKLPTIDGVSMEASSVRIGEKFVLVEATPEYNFDSDINGY